MHRTWLLALACIVAGPLPVLAQEEAPVSAAYANGEHWWAPGQGTPFGATIELENARGRLGIVNAGGDLKTKGHPFFEPIGTNGRACVTCHQPADAMSLAAGTAQQRWDASQGRDPLFAAIDGSNCPHLPQDQKKSHSLLLERGLFRVFLPWPPKGPDG